MGFVSKKRTSYLETDLMDNELLPQRTALWTGSDGSATKLGHVATFTFSPNSVFLPKDRLGVLVRLDSLSSYPPCLDVLRRLFFFGLGFSLPLTLRFLTGDGLGQIIQASLRIRSFGRASCDGSLEYRYNQGRIRRG